MQRPHIGNDVAPRSDFNLDTQARQNARHVGDGLLQWQILARDIGAGVGSRRQGQQGLRIGIEVCYLFNHELGSGLHHLFHGTTFDGTQDTPAVCLGDIRRQFDLDLENLLVAVFRIDNVVMRQTDIFSRNIAGVAVQLHEVSRAQGRRSQEVIEGAGCRAIALVADRLIGHHREIIKLRFKTKFVEKIDLDFHGRFQKGAQNDPGAIMRRITAKTQKEFERADKELCWAHVTGPPLLSDETHAAKIWIFKDLSDKRPIAAELTPREREITTLLAVGSTSKFIAQQIRLSPRTVEMHRARLIRKFSVARSSELAHVLIGMSLNQRPVSVPQS